MGRSSGLRSVGLEVWARSPAMSPPFARRAFLSPQAREGGDLASVAGSALRVDGNDRCPDDGGGEDDDDVPVRSICSFLIASKLAFSSDWSAQKHSLSLTICRCSLATNYASHLVIS